MQKLAALLAVLAAFAVASPAGANGRFPETNQLVIAPSDPSRMLLRTTFGLLVSHDHGATWDWVCDTALGLGPSSIEDPSYGITANTTIIGGTFGGLETSPDFACSWAFAGGDLAQQVALDIVVRPDTPHAALALITKFDMVNDAGDSLYASRVYSSTDDGAHWSAFGAPIDPKAVLETIEVAATDPHRVYLSGYTGTGASPVGVLYVSTDDGATWTPRAIPLAPLENAPYIAAVDPTNADRVYVRTNGKDSSRILVTSDAGKSWTSVLSGTLFTGFALSPDGSRIYVGGKVDGLHVASTADMSFTKRSSISVQCLRTLGSTLYVCSNEVGGFILGSTQDEGATFTPMLHLTSIRGPLSCPPGSSAAACAAEWPALRDSFGIPPTADAGPDAGAGGTSPTKTCGCSAVPANAGAVSLLAILALAALASWRFKTRR